MNTDIEQYSTSVCDALYTQGNSARLKKALEKQDISLAFIGGSITKGWNGTTYLEENYTTHIHSYLSEKYPEKNFSLLNLSTESANSFIGLSITSKVIERDGPDIVFIEYAVNNECGHDHIVSYESLVHRILTLPSAPAVILVFMMNKALYTCQGYMKAIAKHYDLAALSIADSLKKMLENDFDWSVYSDDTIHPNPWGHRFIADCIINYLETAEDSDDEKYSLPAPLYSLDYSGYTSLSAVSENILSEGFEPIEMPWAGEYFNEGRSYIRGKDNAFVRFEADFKNLFVAYMHDKTDRFSDADIYIDGSKAAVLQGKSIYGWGNVVLKSVYSFGSCGHHTVELKVKDSKKEFVLVEYGIS